MKFGIVGVIAFIIDWGILNILVGAFHMHNVLAATISFIISLIFNYVASMKMVFKHREDMARWMEIVIFVVGAVIGLFMNDAIIWISTYGMNHDAYVSQSTEYLIRTNVGKLIATAVVMVWNFLTRKWLLDDTHTNAMNRLKKQENRLTPEELIMKRHAIYRHLSQKDIMPFPGSDPREFWQRAEERTQNTAKLYDKLGMAEYQAIEVFVKMF